jgi:CheY-like chemotaxis protein
LQRFQKLQHLIYCGGSLMNTPSLTVKTILLAEDDDGHARLIERNLSRSGTVDRVIRTRDGQETLDFIRRTGQYADRELDGKLILLLDINMPRVNGLSVLEQIKNDPTKRWLPVIMLTTTDSPSEVQRCYALGCNAYLTKPIDYNDFSKALDRLNQFLDVTTFLSEEEA